MRKIVISLFFLLITFQNLHAETTIKITLLNGSENTFYVSETVDEIYGVKSNLSFIEAGKCIQKFEHKSPIVKMEGLSELKKLKKVSLYMELHGFDDCSVFESNEIESLCLSYGLSEKCFNSIEKMPGLKILYLDSMNIRSMEKINLSDSQIEYLEVAYSHLAKVNKCRFPHTLKYLNIQGNGHVSFDKSTIDEINAKQITLVTDYKIDGIINQIVGDDSARLLPDTFRHFGP